MILKRTHSESFSPESDWNSKHLVYIGSFNNHVDKKIGVGVTNFWGTRSSCITNTWEVFDPRSLLQNIFWFFLLRPDVALSLPCWLSQLNWDSQQDRDRATSGCNKKKELNQTNLILILWGRYCIIKFEFKTT